MMIESTKKDFKDANLNEVYEWFGNHKDDSAHFINEAHARSEFTLFLRGNLNKMLSSAMELLPQVYPAVFDPDTTDGAFKDYASTGPLSNDFGVVQEGSDAWPRLTFLWDTTRLFVVKYGAMFEITREMFDDDRVGEIRTKVNDMAAAHGDWLDGIANDFLEDNSTIYDAGALFRVNHPNLTGGAASANNNNLPALGLISEVNLETANLTVKTWRDYQGKRIRTAIGNYVISSNQEFTMRRIINSQWSAMWPGASNEHKSEPFVVWDRLANNTWYGKTNHKGLWELVRDPVTIERANMQASPSFDFEVYQWKLRSRRNFGCTNWRNIIRCN